MFIIDTALARREQANDPIRVGLVGAGAMARAVAIQIARYTRGIKLVAVSNRRPERARTLLRDAGINRITAADNQAQFDREVERGQVPVVEDPSLLCQSAHLDAIVEITGSVHFAAGVVLDAIDHGKHVIMMNAELDGTVGPILKHHADRKGVVLTNVDGDQPGVLMNLYRFVKGIGIKPVLCGNIKGLQDPYRTPDTQRAFAERWKQSATMVTSFADGTKISFEQALVANATGMRVDKRGMWGPVVDSGAHIDNAASWYDIDFLHESTGVVDYVVGASPGPGVFILGTIEDPDQKHLLELYKLGKGPVYSFYTPYHLCHFEVPNTIARAVLFHDAAIAPLQGPCVDVVTTAKRDIRAGEVLDGLGQYMTYGQCENTRTTLAENLLPIGLAEGCIALHDIAKDTTITWNDVHLPNARLADTLRQEQIRHFARSDQAATEMNRVQSTHKR